MQTGKRLRAYPTPAQEQILLQWIGHQRFIYNAKVSEDRYDRAFAQKAVSLSGTPVPIDQEYARFIGPENRPSRAEFVCQRCGLKDNADHNASRVIARRGIRLLLEGKIQKKEVRGVAGSGNRNTQGRNRPKSKPPERTIRRKGPRAFAHPRRKRNVRS
jgi:hypothetical protein